MDAIMIEAQNEELIEKAIEGAHLCVEREPDCMAVSRYAERSSKTAWVWSGSQ
jgi:hypothetical protein